MSVRVSILYGYGIKPETGQHCYIWCPIWPRSRFWAEPVR